MGFQKSKTLIVTTFIVFNFIQFLSMNAQNEDSMYQHKKSFQPPIGRVNTLNPDPIPADTYTLNPDPKPADSMATADNIHPKPADSMATADNIHPKPAAEHNHLHPHIRRRMNPKREFLKAHNKIRRRMREPLFKWDNQLAEYARSYAHKRADDCLMVHSGGPYGENIFQGTFNHWTPSEVVSAWADEKAFYDPKANTCQFGEMCGHYTQIVWRDSNKLGCARVDCKNGGLFAICVYDPPGNFIGENPFVPFVPFVQPSMPIPGSEIVKEFLGSVNPNP